VSSTLRRRPGQAADVRRTWLVLVHRRFKINCWPTYVCDSGKICSKRM